MNCGICKKQDIQYPYIKVYGGTPQEMAMCRDCVNAGKMPNSVENTPKKTNRKTKSNDD